MNTSFIRRQFPIALFAISCLLSSALTGALFAQEGWQTATLLVRVSKSEQQVQQEQQLQKSLEELQARAIEQPAVPQENMQDESAQIINLDGIKIHVGALNQHGKQMNELKQKIAQNKRMAERCKRALVVGQQACEELIWTLNQEGGFQAGIENNLASAAFAQALAGLQTERDKTSQQFGADHPRVKSLNKKIESLEEALKNQTGEAPNPGNQADKVDETLTALQSELDVVLERFGPDHPIAKSLNQKIEEYSKNKKLEEQLKNQTDEVLNPGGQADNAKMIVAALRLELDEVKKRFGANHPRVKDLNSRIESWNDNSKKQVVENEDADKPHSAKEQVSRLRAKFQTEVELDSERLSKLSERSKEHAREVGDQVGIQKEFEQSNDIFLAVTTSRQFIEEFAKKYISLFDGDDAGLVATQLASQMFVKPDELGQPNVYQIKLNNKSALLGKGLIKLWVNELKSNLNSTGKVERIKSSLVELKKRREETRARISALEGETDETGNSAKLAELQRELSVFDERIHRATEFIQKSRSQRPQVKIQVLEASWTLTTDETKEYDKLRTQYPLLPELKD